MTEVYQYSEVTVELYGDIENKNLACQKGNKYSFESLASNAFESLLFTCFLICPILFFGNITVYPQTFSQQFAPGSSGYLNKSSVFRQEIARLEISVVREGKSPISITQVPRVQKDDVIKVKMVDEPVGGIRPEQSYWDWTFLVAYVNPNRNNDKQKSVSEEIQFRKRGWYKEYLFVVPYDSQPVFFLYPKPKYRNKILSVINKKYEEIRKLGEKTIEVAGAYAQINSFLNELQFVMQRTQMSTYGSFITYPNSTSLTANYNSNNTAGAVYNYNAFLEQTIERLARSFNIQLPQCWQSTNGGINYGNYAGYGNSGYNSYNTYGSYNLGYSNSNNFGYGISPDLIGRVQCVAKNVRFEDFDISIGQMLKQGGLFAATQLRDKFPQLAYWITIAAAALDFIVRVFQKSALRIVPTIIQSSDNSLYGTNQGFSASYSSSTSSSQNFRSQPEKVKLSLFAESQPTDDGFVTAYPIVVHKWQSEPDPEVISLTPPILSEPCLHIGMNILKNADLTSDQLADTFTKDYKLIMSSANGFRKEFLLRKNIGMNGWELNISSEDLNAFPKLKMSVESEIVGTRGFNEIKSPKFQLPIEAAGNWEITSESQKEFSVGGKRRVSLQNSLGSCRCLQAVIYKPSAGGQFVFEANRSDGGLQFSNDGKEASFEVDTSHFQPGQGQLELRLYGGESIPLNLKLYPASPRITDFKINRGDNFAIIKGEQLEQLQFVKINGKRAVFQGSSPNTALNNSNGNQSNQSPGSQLSSSMIMPSQSSNQNFSQGSYQNQYGAFNQNERIAIFENSTDKVLSNNVTLELGLEDNRMLLIPQKLSVGLARPTLIAGAGNEIEGVFINNQFNKTKPQIDLSKYPVVSIDAPQLSIQVQNSLADYEFQIGNIQIEPGIEKLPGINIDDLPKITFEILDGNNLRINFAFSGQSGKFLSGKRVQFRIKDRQRGNSDWYTIKQTFVRIPHITAVKCPEDMSNQCQLFGHGIDYIQQVSINGGLSWYPQDSGGLVVQLTADGQMTALIPHFTNKKMLQIKLRDFSQTEGLIITDYSFINLVKSNFTKRRRASLGNPILPNSNNFQNQLPNQAPNTYWIQESESKVRTSLISSKVKSNTERSH